MNVLARFTTRHTTRSGRRTRARLHGPLSPLGKQRSRGLILRIAGISLALLLIGVVAVNAYIQSLIADLPVIPRNLSSTTFGVGDTRIYDSSGTQMLADVGNQGDHRINVPLSEVSPKLVQATVAVEDRTFWTNPGFDPQGIGRAALSDVRHHSVVGGGSTITQQLAKKMFLSPQQTFDRKIKELVLADRLTRAYSKQQILDLYLNENNYAEQQYGVEAASMGYFNKPAKDLDLAQAALLAGIPQEPAVWNPVLHLSMSKERQREVLNSMVAAGYVSTSEAHQAFIEPLQVSPPANHYQAPHFVNYVQQELRSLGFDPGRQQMTVKTTLDWTKQKLGQSIVVSNLAKQQPRDPGGQLSSAMVSLDPKTGNILAYVGSPDYNNPNGGQFDFLGGGPNAKAVNPGSSIKPFTYASAIDAHLATMDTPIMDGPQTYVVSQPGGETYSVHNYDNKAHGVQPLRKALASSLNIPAVKVEMAVGVPQVVEFWRKMGLHPLDQNFNANGPDTNYRASMTLGGAPVMLLDEAAAYDVLADGGVYHQPEAILQVTDSSGKVLYQSHPEQHQSQVLDPGVAYIIGAIISNDANRSVSFSPNGPLVLPGHQAAAKTGTSESFKDALTAGYTPDLVSLFWVGDILNNQHYMRDNSDGIDVAAPAWHDFMMQSLKGVPNHWFSPPSDVQPGKDGSWFLKGVTDISHLPNDNPSPSPSPGDKSQGGTPGNPNAGPQPVKRRGGPSPLPTICPLFDPTCKPATPAPGGIPGG